jgi:hypothetical protein
LKTLSLPLGRSGCDEGECSGECAVMIALAIRVVAGCFDCLFARECVQVGWCGRRCARDPRSAWSVICSVFGQCEEDVGVL